MPEPKTISPSKQIALWADQLRDLSAAGLKYAENAYDKHRDEAIQEMAIDWMIYSK